TGLFLRNSAQKLNVAVRRLTPEAQEAMLRFDYPGNIRQLENFCHWLTVMASGQWVDVGDLPPEILALRDESRGLQGASDVETGVASYGFAGVGAGLSPAQSSVSVTAVAERAAAKEDL